MLKARGSGSRQTRSRSAKAAPKRASAPAKVTEEPQSEAGVSSPKRASAPAKAAEDKIQAGTSSVCICTLLSLTGVLSGVLLIVFSEHCKRSCCCSSVYGLHLFWSCCMSSAADGFEERMFAYCVDGWDPACDVLYTDLMSLMYPDDNTHSLMLHPSRPSF